MLQDPAAAGPSLQLAQHLLQRYDSRDYYREAVFEPLDDPTPAYGSASGSGGSGPGLGPPPMSPIAQGPENAAFMVQGGGGSGVDALEQGGTATAAAGGGGHASHSNGGTSQNGGRGGGGVHGRFHSPSHGGGMELCGRVPSPAALVCCQDHNLGCKFREEDLRIVVRRVLMDLGLVRSTSIWFVFLERFTSFVNMLSQTPWCRSSRHMPSHHFCK